MTDGVLSRIWEHAAGEMKANRRISKDASLRTDEMMQRLGVMKLFVPKAMASGE